MTEFELSQEDVQAIKEASQPVPYMIFGGVEPESAYDRSMRVWVRLGEKYGFHWNSAEAVPGKPEQFIRAVAK